MPLPTGTYELGPENAALSVHTGRAGAAAKAGHDLVIDVTRWEGTLTVGDEPSVQLTADPASLRVHSGTGGMQALGEDDRDKIHKTIGDDVLRGQSIVFRSTAVAGQGETLAVEGELTLAGRGEPLSFTLELGDDGSVRAEALVTQSAWGIRPYSALFGALRVADEVRVALEGRVGT